MLCWMFWQFFFVDKWCLFYSFERLIALVEEKLLTVYGATHFASAVIVLNAKACFFALLKPVFVSSILSQFSKFP